MGVPSEDEKRQSTFPGLRQGQESLWGSSQLCFLLGTVPDVRRMTDRRGTRITRALGAVCQAGSQIDTKSKPGRQTVQKEGPKPRSTTNSHLRVDFSPSVASWGCCKDCRSSCRKKLRTTSCFATLTLTVKPLPWEPWLPPAGMPPSSLFTSKGFCSQREPKLEFENESAPGHPLMSR